MKLSHPRPEDWPLLTQLDAALQHQAISRSCLAALSPQLCWLGWREQQPVAYALVQDGYDCLEILALAVVVEQRGQGLAGQLLNAIDLQAKELDREAVLLEVAAKNKQAMRLYQRHGFVEEGRRRGYYANGDDALLMRRSVG